MAINVFIKATSSIHTNERNQEQKGPAAGPAGRAVTDTGTALLRHPGLRGAAAPRQHSHPRPKSLPGLAPLSHLSQSNREHKLTRKEVLSSKVWPSKDFPVKTQTYQDFNLANKDIL